MLKKRIIVFISIVLILLILFLPIPRGTYKDGGTRDYCALTYRIVIWNRFVEQIDENGSVEEVYTYHKTSVFWIPDNFKGIDALWKTETERNHQIRVCTDSTKPGTVR